MRFNKLKELVRKLGGVLVLDGEEPEFVILSYRQYEKIESGEEVRFSTDNNDFRMHGARDNLTETNGLADIVADRSVNGGENEQEAKEVEAQEAVERLNQEISTLKEEIRLKEEAELIENEQSTEPIAETVDFN